MRTSEFPALAVTELAVATRGPVNIVQFRRVHSLLVVAVAETAAAVKVDDGGHVNGGLVDQEGDVGVVDVNDGHVGDHGF